MTGSEARKIFLEYFKKHNHHYVRSSSLVPQNDPTLLFVNAGMVQFKRLFTGDEKRDYTRAVTFQKCVRAGGKHNDLENVGYTARHHTFFEMLGNFSFGDYFKKEAIAFGWDLLTNGYGFDKERLYVSVYHEDDEAYEIWRDQEKVPEKHIFRLGETENFWTMGDTGPCGPCSEIHIDRGREYGCGRKDCAVGCDCDRWLELWNLVFMQFERDQEGNMTPLPKPSIDTGLGLERIISVLQDVPTNYDTDLFMPIMAKVGELAGKNRYESREVDVAMKVIADHSRATAFLICDGVIPSNEGRGYVLRRIMRRAIRYGRSIGLKDPFLHMTVQTVFFIMEEAYPELKENAAFIVNVVKNEESKFLETLGSGMKFLETTIASLKKQKETEIPGEIAFKLYDTFGIPVDIIMDHIKQTGITLDLEGFDVAMSEQKARSKSSQKFIGVDQAYKSLISAGIKTLFKGYNTLEIESKILLFVKDSLVVDTVKKSDQIEIVTDATVFYPERGGQISDTGFFENQECTIEIHQTLTDPSGLFIHKGKVISGQCSQGDRIMLKVDSIRRQKIAVNHTATHMLHAALKRVLGDHLKQAGSFVTNDRLRFDFTHYSNITNDELTSIEEQVNLWIRENNEISTKETKMEDALKSGAIALFEEKYGDVVRVVSQGNYSSELCGGTHTRWSGDIGFFKILSEKSIASGIRRIEAVTGQMAIDLVHEYETEINAISTLLKVTRDNIIDKLETLIRDKKLLENELESLKTKLACRSLEDIESNIKEINGVRVLAQKVAIENPSQLRELADKFKNKLKSGILLLGAESNGKVLLISIVTKDLTEIYQAGNIIKKAASIVGGGGGGRSDMAQAGGTKPENLDLALESIYDIIKKTINL